METADLSQLTYNIKITMTQPKNNFLWNTKGCTESVEEENNIKKLKVCLIL